MLHWIQNHYLGGFYTSFNLTVNVNQLKLMGYLMCLPVWIHGFIKKDLTQINHLSHFKYRLIDFKNANDRFILSFQQSMKLIFMSILAVELVFYKSDSELQNPSKPNDRGRESNLQRFSFNSLFFNPGTNECRTETELLH